MRISKYIFFVAVNCALVFAQPSNSSSASPDNTTQTIKSLSADPFIGTAAAGTQPTILNILTVVGADGLGLPCLDCLLGGILPSLGLPIPVGKVFQGGKYQIDSYLIDNDYTGPCTFTSAVRDSHNNVVVSASQTLNETARTVILLSTPVTMPSGTGVGLGSVSNTAVCGPSTTKSKSPVVLACVNNPPFCVE